MAAFQVSPEGKQRVRWIRLMYFLLGLVEIFEYQVISIAKSLWRQLGCWITYICRMPFARVVTKAGRELEHLSSGTTSYCSGAWFRRQHSGRPACGADLLPAVALNPVESEPQSFYSGLLVVAKQLSCV